MAHVVAAALFVDRSDDEFRLAFRNRVDLLAPFGAEIAAKTGALGSNDETSAAAVDLVEAVLGGEFGRRRLGGVVPDELDRAARIGRGELELGSRACRERIEVVSGGRRADARRVPKIDRLEDHVDVMARHIAERAGPEIPPAAPLERVVVAGPELAFRRHADPGVPVEVLARRFICAFFSSMSYSASSVSSSRI